MRLFIAGSQLECHLRFVQRFVEPVLGGQRAGQAVVAARQVRHQGEGILEFFVGLVEEAGRPLRVSVKGQDLGTHWRLLLEDFRFFLGLEELTQPQGRLHHAHPRLQGQRLAIGIDRQAERRERFPVSRLFEEQRPQLKLEGGIVPRRTPLDTRSQRREHGHHHQRLARSNRHRTSHQVQDRA